MQRKFKVSEEGALGEVSRFFGGWVPTLHELMQNAYRAGARNVDIRANENGSVIEISDDGCGCPNDRLDMLLTAFESGWDSKKVTAAAGLGFYSIFNPEIIRKVRVESSDWQIERDNELPMSMGVEERRLHGTRGGFFLRLEMVAEHDKLREEVEEARALYPFQVTLNGERVEAKQIESEVTVCVPGIGEVGWRQYFHVRDVGVVIWEYTPFKSQVLMDALRRQVEKLPVDLRPYANQIVSDCMLTWWVDPACGATPKLPDRNEMEANLKLDAAAKALLRALSEQVREEAIGLVQNLPDQFENLPRLPREKSYLCRFLKPALRDCGWKHVTTANLRGLESSTYHDGDGWVLEIRHNGALSVYDKHAVPVRQADLATLLHARSLGLIREGFCVDQTRDAIPVKINGLKADPSESSLIALADSITWNGVPLPFYLVEEGETVSGSEHVILAGNWRAAMKILQREKGSGVIMDIVEGFIADRIDCEGDWWERGDGNWVEWREDGGIQFDVIEAYLAEEITKNFATAEDLALLQQKAKYLAILEDTQKALSKCGQHSGPEAEPLAAAINALSKARDACCVRLRETEAAIQKAVSSECPTIA